MTTPYQQVYDFENAVESAVERFLSDNGITTLASANVPDFQLARPRVEVMFVLGAGQLRWASRSNLPVFLQKFKIESAWKAALFSTAICSVDSAGKSTSSDFRAKLRFLYATMAPRVNGTLLPLHTIQLVKENGSQRVIRPDQGYEELKFSHELDLSINAQAWALLTQTTN